jgi:hypothetical protein
MFLTEAANRGSISTGYDIDNSLKFERDSNEAVETTNQAGGNRKTWTFSAWIKRTALSEDYHTIFGAEYTNIQIMSNNRPRLVLYNGTSYYADPEMLLRDTSAWYHIVVQLDTTQSTAADRVKWWINGERVTTFNNSTYTNMTQNTDFSGIGQPSSYGSGGWLRLGRFFSGDEGFDGYMADVYYLNGTAAEADDFGEYDADSGIWIPKEYTGSGYGTQGFHYKFDNASNLGEDSSGEGHDANSLSNITAADQSTDTPTNNFCTLNPIFTNSGSANYQTINEGATKFVNAGNAYRLAVANMGVTSGKWYWEVKATSVGAVMYMGITYPSVWDTDYTLGGTIFLDDNNDPVRYNNSSRSSFGSAFGNGDIIAFALDMDASTPTMTVYKNNSSLGNLMSGLSIGGTGAAFLPPKEDGYFPKVGGYGAMTFECNFGGYTSGTPSSAATDENGYGSFEYAPPTGFYALCTKNLAEYG